MVPVQSASPTALPMPDSAEVEVPLLSLLSNGPPPRRRYIPDPHMRPGSAPILTDHVPPSKLKDRLIDQQDDVWTRKVGQRRHMQPAHVPPRTRLLRREVDPAPRPYALPERECAAEIERQRFPWRQQPQEGMPSMKIAAERRAAAAAAKAALESQAAWHHKRPLSERGAARTAAAIRLQCACRARLARRRCSMATAVRSSLSPLRSASSQCRPSVHQGDEAECAPAPGFTQARAPSMAPAAVDGFRACLMEHAAQLRLLLKESHDTEAVPIARRREHLDRLCEALSDQRVAGIRNEMPAPAIVMADRLLQLAQWETEMVESGRPAAAMRGLRTSIPTLLASLVRVLNGDVDTREALDTAGLSPSRRGKRAHPPSWPRAEPSVADLMRSEPALQRPQTSGPSVAGGERPGRRCAKNGWEASGLEDTRDNYPLPAHRSGINGGLAGAY